MPIPARVREDAQAAEQALQQLANPTAVAPPAPAPDAPPADPATPPVEPVATIPPPPPAPAPSAHPTSPETELQRLNQQLQTEQGRRTAQEAELAEMRGRYAAMQEQLARLQQQPAAPAAPAAPAPSLITDEDRNDFGEDMIDFVGRMIRQTLGDSLTQLGARLTGIENRLKAVTQQATTAAKTAEQQAFEAYIAKLDGRVPGWRETNDDAGFVDWLKNRDRFARKTRHELLAAAHNEADADTVAEFFEAYWQETGRAAPAPTPAPTPAPQPAAPTVDPQTLVAPSPSSAPTPAANPRAGKIWTQADIEQVYDDRMKKRISAEDFAAKEAEIQQALLEGRVRA